MSEGRGEGRKRGRLSRSGDFDRAYRDGRSHANRYVVLYAFPRGDDGSGGGEAADEVRLGISVGRRVGDAVDRNRVKRTMREAFWALGDRLPPGHDFVLVGRTGIADLVEREGMNGMKRSIAELLTETETETDPEDAGS